MATFTPKQTGYVPINDTTDSIPPPSLSPTSNPLPSSSSSYPSHLSYNSSAFISPQQQPGLESGNGGDRINKYETRLPVRLDVEAASAYVLGLVSAALLLIMETKNDYVRFHAWQSALVFMTLGGSMFLISFISSFLYWILLLAHFGAGGWLAYNAYINSDTLERYEAPYLGKIASDWVDSE